MAVYVDQSQIPLGRMKMSHMIADTLPELHAMADRIGLKREYFQIGASFPHYDVSQKLKAKAIEAGALLVDRQRLVMKMRQLRNSPRFIEQWQTELERAGAVRVAVPDDPGEARNA